MRSALILCWFALGSITLTSGCGLFVRPRPLPTIPGPESPEVARGTNLWLVEIRDPYDEGVRRLADGERVPFHHPPGQVMRVSGPDQDGRIAYQLGQQKRSHRIWIDDIESPAPYQPFPLAPGERHFNILGFALSPSGGRLAISTYRVPDEDPEARIEALEVFDLSTGTLEKVWTGGCYELTWLGDARRLAFIGEKDERPAVRILDLDSGSITKTWEVNSVADLWSGPGGKHLYYRGRWGTALWRMDLATEVHESWSLPGLLTPIAFSSDGRVLGYGLPTKGSKQEYRHSPIYGPRPKFAIKLFDMETGAFCTVSSPGGFGNLFSAGELRE